MEAIIFVAIIFLFIFGLYWKTIADEWKTKAQKYEHIMDQLIPEINRFQKILDDDQANKIERLKKIQKLSWKELEYENTRKN